MTHYLKKLGATLAVLATVCFTPIPAGAQDARVQPAEEMMPTELLTDENITDKILQLRAPGERQIYDVDTSDWDFNEPGMNKNNIDNHYYEQTLPDDLGEPQPVVIPGKMRSDRIELPEGITKEEADEAEIQEAHERGVSLERAQPLTQPLTASNCRTYWPTTYQVCGAIREKYEALATTWVGQNPISFLGLPRSNELTNPDGVGKRTEFDNGFIYWHPSTGAWSVTTHNSIVWARNGWELGRLGYPTSDEIGTGDNVGRKQSFQRGRIYGSLSGVVSIEGKILEKWIETGEERGPLGYPATDEEGTPDGIGRFNRFALGMIYWHPTYGAHPVLGAILLKWSAAGFERSSFGYPIEDPVPTNQLATIQKFERDTIRILMSPVPELAYLMNIPSRKVDEFYDQYVQLLNDKGVDVTSGFQSAYEHARYSAEEVQKEINSISSESSPQSAVIAQSIFANGTINSGESSHCDDQFKRLPGNERTNRGDLFYSGGTTMVKGTNVNHRHTGIFVTLHGNADPKRIDTVEAVNPEKGVVRVSGSHRNRICNPRYFSVKTNHETRLKAASFAESKINSAYDARPESFLISRYVTKDSTAFNCASLVWAAYMHASQGSVDIGDNKYFPKSGNRFSVFPIDIANSVNTREFQ